MKDYEFVEHLMGNSPKEIITSVGSKADRSGKGVKNETTYLLSVLREALPS
jgi:hypothetical protein